MTVFLIVFLGIVIIGAIAAYWLVGEDDPSHDPMRRAGEGGDVSPEEAARRAMGRGPTTQQDEGWR